MTTINIAASTVKGMIEQIQEVLGGEIKERWGEHVLEIANGKAKGYVRFIEFDWGGSLINYKITLQDDVKLIVDTSKYNPIQFIYASKGYFNHKFEKEDNERKIDTMHPAIITGKEGGYIHKHFPKNEPLDITLIKVSRMKFLKRRLNDASLLNKQLFEVFHDAHQDHVYAYYGTYNLKLEQLVKALDSVAQKGIMRIMLIEGVVYQILALIMAHHTQDMKAKNQQAPLTKSELKAVKKVSDTILKDIAKDFNVEALALKSGLTQAKLQEGFKHLFSKTVIEYIRHVRLEKARDLMNSTDLNISQIVYSIGFSSRSYFSKIFKEKYGVSPSAFIKNKRALKTR